MNDLPLLDSLVEKTKVNWHSIADSINITRNKLYHWYTETHLRRSFNSKMTIEERKQMLNFIMLSINNREIEDINFQQKLKQYVFKDKNIHRVEFSMVFNNIMRTKAVKNAI